jgi:hypothetical protein
MKYILLLILVAFELFAGIVKSPVLSVDEKNETLSINVKKVDIGMSGFAVHTIADGHTSILNNVVVIAYDEQNELATLKMMNFNTLRNNALPTGKWKIVPGDMVELAFAYSRALLISPSEEIYHRISKSVNIQWIHPDLFATVLSFRGHPTPLKEDFEAMGIASSVGLLFIYLDKKLYTLDIQSFKILNISEAPLTQDSVKLPFYSRVEKIEANWFGDGSDELEAYEPHYYELLIESNKKDERLYEIVKNSEKLHDLLDKFDLGK